MLDIFLQALIISGGLFWLGLKFYKGESKRWGGVILVVVFVGMVLGHRELEITRQLQGILVGSVMILLFGLWDDWKNLSWKMQAAFQIVLVILLVYFGFNIEYFMGVSGGEIRLDKVLLQGISVGSCAFIFFWVIGIINAINWSDGVDSSMNAIAMVGGLSLVFVSFLPEVNQPAVAILASIFLGSLVGFLIFNLPPAKVEAGTSGSYFVGFILASLAIVAGSKIITVMIVLVLPLVDFVWVVAGRWRNKKSIFKKDKSHLHYRLRKIGWSDRKIFLSYFVFLGSVLVIYSLLDSRVERILLVVMEAVFLIGAFGLIRRYLKVNKILLN
jgi:UDP-GlcNAc:undecaprenyl-phosphate GlcNAc-1-phosphate transferase